jgi:hypothetical protein
MVQARPKGTRVQWLCIQDRQRIVVHKVGDLRHLCTLSATLLRNMSQYICFGSTGCVARKLCRHHSRSPDLRLALLTLAPSTVPTFV